MGTSKSVIFYPPTILRKPRFEVSDGKPIEECDIGQFLTYNIGVSEHTQNTTKFFLCCKSKDEFLICDSWGRFKLLFLTDSTYEIRDPNPAVILINGRSLINQTYKGDPKIHCAAYLRFSNLYAMIGIHKSVVVLKLLDETGYIIEQELKSLALLGHRPLFQLLEAQSQQNRRYICMAVLGNGELQNEDMPQQIQSIRHIQFWIWEIVSGRRLSEGKRIKYAVPGYGMYWVKGEVTPSNTFVFIGYLAENSIQMIEFGIDGEVISERKIDLISPDPTEYCHLIFPSPSSLILILASEILNLKSKSEPLDDKNKKSVSWSIESQQNLRVSQHLESSSTKSSSALIQTAIYSRIRDLTQACWLSENQAILLARNGSQKIGIVELTA